MTDDKTPTTDETPPAAPIPIEAPTEERAEGDSAQPVEPVAEQSPPAVESAAPPPPPEEPTEPEPPAESSEPAPLVAESTQPEIPEPAPVTEAATEEPPPLPTEEPSTAEVEPAPAEPAKPVAAPKPRKPRKSAKTAAAAAATESESTATATAEPPAELAADGKKKWYAVKVQSGREESIKAAIERKVKIENLEPYFGQIVIPVEEVNEKKKVKVKVKDKKTGDVETTTQERNVVKKIKKFPGYLFTEVEFNDEILYVFRETSGVGDFVGIPARRGQGGERLAPAPMTEAEVQSMLTGVPVPGDPRKGAKKTVVKLDYEKGDKVRIKNGAFAGHEAEVKAITEAKDPTDSPKVTVVVTMWGRGVDVTLDYWEVDKA